MKSKSLIWVMAGVLLMLVLVQGVQAAETYGFVTKWGGVSSPYQMAVYSGNIYVADAGNNQIQWFNLDGVYQGQFGTFGSGNNQFNNPMSIAIDKNNGNIYVADTHNNRIQMFDSSWAYQRSWPSSSPYSVAVGGTLGHVYVASQEHPLGIREYDPLTGTLLATWGSEGESGDGCDWPGQIGRAHV
jgi:DNA-binding beta-propeller fold protein YncE